MWIDDESFDIHYHVRHDALPRPGGIRQLQRLAGRVFSQRLDRGHPLWEVWIIEGVEGDRFALIAKLHHSMIDGSAGVDLLRLLLRADTSSAVPEPQQTSPRPPPRWHEVMRGELRHRGRGLAAMAGDLRHGQPGRRVESARALFKGALATVRVGLTPSSSTPFNPERISPDRRFDWLATELEGVKAVKRALGGTVNDVVLAAVAGGVRRYLARSGHEPDRIHDFRAFVPVNVRQGSDGRLGNRVAMLMAPLPVDLADPEARYRQVCDTTRELKDSAQTRTAQLFEDLSDFTSVGAITRVFGVASRIRSFNVVVTNIPGPPFPLFLLGARLHEVYPFIPLCDRQSLAIGLLSNAGRLFWGFSADKWSLPNVHALVEDVAAELGVLGLLAAPQARTET